MAPARRAGAPLTTSTFSSSSRRCTVRRTCTSTSCSVRSASSMTASRPCTTCRRFITRRSIRTPPSRRCSIRDAAPPSAISRAREATRPNYAYPQDAFRINKQWFSSSDQLVSMIMGGEVYLGAADLPTVLDDRAPARSPDRGAHPVSVRDPPDPRPARPGPGGRRPNGNRRQLKVGPTTCSST